jgi:UDP:flavonoid glycosyltransferase YjiC (YdhE family)
MNTLMEISRSFDDALISDIWSASESCDALVYSAPLAFHGYYAARARGVRSAAALIQPLDYRDGSRLQQVMWQMFRGPIRRWQRGMGYPPAPLLGPFRQWRAENLPIMYGLSPSVLPGLGRAPDRYATGYWFLDSPRDSLPDKVEDFLADGDPPVYVSFGSMPTREPERLTEIVTAAVEHSGDRALLATGWGGLAAAHRRDRVLCVGDLPHDLLFPRVRAVVHHGGVMITAEGLRAGRPTVVIPSVLDQFGWGRRVAALGVGPDPVPRRRLAPARLAEALIATREEGMRAAAAGLGGRIRAEHGVDLAITALEKVFQA